VKYSVIHFLSARNLKLADIRRRICEIYREDAMSDGMVRKWVRKFNEGCDNVHDEPRSSQPSAVSGVFTGGHILQGGYTETGAPL
jgi:transposase